MTFVPRHGRIPKSPAHLWIADKLADREWHDATQLTKELLASDVTLPINTNNYSRKAAARNAVNTFAKRNYVESEYRPLGQTHRLERLRLSPVNKPLTSLRSCDWCGRPNLTINERVRRLIEYRSPLGSKKGDYVAARIKSEFICLPCCEKELATNNRTWRQKPGEGKPRTRRYERQPILDKEEHDVASQ